MIKMLDIAMIEQQYQELAEVIKQLAQYGPFAGILMTMLEAFFPPFPLVVLVTVNVIAYGFVLGYLYSFIGTFIGSYIFYLLISTLGRRWFARMVHRSKRFDHLLSWIQDKGFVPIFALLAFPLTPSIIVSGLAGLAGVKKDEFVAALFLGKLVMVFSLSYIGYNVASFVQQPMKSVAMILVVVALSYLGRRIIGWYERKAEDRHRKKTKKDEINP